MSIPPILTPESAMVDVPRDGHAARVRCRRGQTGETETRNGALVGISHDEDVETGFTASWTTTVTEATTGPTCDALTAWAVRVVPTAEAGEIRSSCRGAGDGGGIFASAGTEPDESGRLMMFAFADSDSVASGAALTATLKFKAAAQ